MIFTNVLVTRRLKNFTAAPHIPVLLDLDIDKEIGKVVLMENRPEGLYAVLDVEQDIAGYTPHLSFSVERYELGKPKEGTVTGIMLSYDPNSDPSIGPITV